MDKWLLFVLTVTVLVLSVYLASFAGAFFREKGREENLLVPVNKTEQPFSTTVNYWMVPSDQATFRIP